MRGLMMDWPLLISSQIRHAASYFGDQEIVSRTVEGPIHRYTYADLHARSQRLANVLTHLGVRDSDRVGTLAWNGYRHLEIYFAVSGMGAVCHTLNPRLHPDQLSYIVNHAEDRVLFADITFLPLIAAVADRIPTVEHVVVMTDREHMPDTKLSNAPCYEDLMDKADPSFAWPALDENTASSLCYTSGTTGEPKGVLYSHRSTVLHSYAAALPDVMNLGERATVLPVVPMFHVNAWGLPYAAAMTGTRLVLPGPRLDGASLTELITTENVTMAAGVPTVWLGLLNHLRSTGTRVPSLTMMLVGGAAPPPSMIDAFQTEYGIDFRHAWGMTEMSPLGTVSRLKPSMDNAPAASRLAVQTRQGRAAFGVEMKVVGEDGADVPRDGQSFGELRVRGPWIASSYHGLDEGDRFTDGWFGTGDVATIDEHGYMNITDRVKDVIKSGGEWISSIDIENLAAGHPGVAQAAVIGVPDEKWNERPLLIVVPAEGATPSGEDLRAYLDGKVPKWWIPDTVEFVESLPIGATGKVLKTALRQQFAKNA